jgi:LysM repeat protein
VVHGVRAGDSLDRIAAAYGITPEAIAAANALVSPAAVTAGQRLVIPLGSAQPGPSRPGSPGAMGG